MTPPARLSACWLTLQCQDPLNGIKNRSRQRDPSPVPKGRTTDAGSKYDQGEKSEKLLRERSIKTNRRHKFEECLSSQDVNIGASPSAVHMFFFR